MSTIASFYVLSRADIPGLVRAAQTAPAVHDFLAQHARDLDTPEELFAWSGMVMDYLIMYLEEGGVTLGQAEYEAECDTINEAYNLTYLFTNADKANLSALDPAAIDRAAIAEYFAELDYGFEELPLAIDDGLKVLREQIAALSDDEVLLLNIG